MDLDIIIYFFLQIFTQRNQLILIKGKFHGTIALSIWNIERAKIDNVLMRQSTARRSCQTFLIDSHQTFLGQWGSVILLEANISRKRAAVNINCNIFTYIQGDFFYWMLRWNTNPKKGCQLLQEQSQSSCDAGALATILLRKFNFKVLHSAISR